jgi:uncharacterized membrane protein
LAIGLSGPVAFLMSLIIRARMMKAERRISQLERELYKYGPLNMASEQRPPRLDLPSAAASAVDAPPPIEEPPPVMRQKFQPSAPPSQSSPSRGLEERFGTRWTVWIGGVALALGGLLLVRYSIEQGYFGPAARCVLGGVFGSALVLALLH